MTFWHLLTATARHLTGSRVVIRNRPPIFQGDIACAYKRRDGTPIIDLSPDISNSEFMTIFLHEVAHVTYHVGKFAAIDTERPPQSVPQPVRTTTRQAEYAYRENEADKAAAAWKMYAEKHYMNYDGYSMIERQLQALVKMEIR